MGMIMKDQRTDQELNRIIAEWMGWKQICDWSDPFSGRFGLYGYPPFERNEEKPVLNYCKDLNAIHKAEKKATFAELTKQHHVMFQTAWDNDPDTVEQVKFDLVYATARQRAEALVAIIEATK